MGATYLAPELALSQAQAGDMAGAIKKVNDLYPNTPFTIPPKVEAWFMLVVVLVGIYWPKYNDYTTRIKAEKREGKKALAQVQPIAPLPSSAPAHIIVDTKALIEN